MSPQDPNRVTRGALPLLFYTFLQHPEASVRQQVQQHLDAWVEEGTPHFSAEAVEQVLQAASGTPLEPFRLDPDNRKVATWLVRIAFSKRYRQTRVVINSTFNPQNKGGLVVTKDLKAFFVERLRFVRKRRRKVPPAAWAFHPGRCPDPDDVPKPLEAVGLVGERGYEAQLDIPLWLQTAWGSSLFARRPSRPILLATNSRLHHGQSLVDEGIGVSTKGRTLSLVLERPEQVLRLGPRLLSKGLKLILTTGEQEAAHVELDWKVSGTTPLMLKALPRIKRTDLNHWCDVGPLKGPLLPPPLKEQITQWIVLP